MSWFSNNRYMERIDWQTPVVVSRAGTRNPIDDRAQLWNISKHGLGITTTTRLTKNIVYMFEFRMGDQPWGLRGRVVHEKQGNSYIYYGISLDPLSGSERRAWARFVRPYSGKVQFMSVLYGLIAGGLAGYAIYRMGYTMPKVYSVSFIVLISFVWLLPF